MASYLQCGVCSTDLNSGDRTCTKTICVSKRYFRPTCRRTDPMCNPLAGAYVAASTVCAQAIFTGLESMVDPLRENPDLPISCDAV